MPSPSYSHHVHVYVLVQWHAYVHSHFWLKFDAFCSGSVYLFPSWGAGDFRNMPGGGAHRQPAPTLCTASLQECLTSYLAGDVLPFQFGCYNLMQPSQAASGLGLLGCSFFLRKWLSYFPDCALCNKQFVLTLANLVQSGCLSRFPMGHTVWEHTNVMDDKSRSWWAAKQCAKLTVIFYHLRRLKGDEVKRRQAFRTLPEKEATELDGLLAMVRLPPKKEKKQKTPKRKRRACLSMCNTDICISFFETQDPVLKWLRLENTCLDGWPMIGKLQVPYYHASHLTIMQVILLQSHKPTPTHTHTLPIKAQGLMNMLKER